MKAARLHNLNEALRIEECAVPRATTDQVVVQVQACGVCGSDLSIIQGKLKSNLPCTLGHEIAGRVAIVGPDCRRTAAGQRVVVYMANGCGQCVACLRGEVFCCVKGAHRFGITRDGGFAQYIVVPENNLIPLPDSVSFDAGAVLTDAVATCLHAMEDVANVKAGETVCVFGVGGLGTAAVQIAKMHGCRVIGVSRSEAKRELALSLGADDVVVGGTPDAVASQLREVTGGRGVDVAVQLVPNPEVDEQAIASLAAFGRAVLVAFTPQRFAASSLDLILRQVAVLSSRGMTKRNIERAISLAAGGQIDVAPLVRSPRPLGEINAVLDEFRAGKLIRAVIHPQEA